MYIEYHVRCYVADGGVFVGVQVVEELYDSFFRELGCFSLFGCDAAEGDQCSEVDGPCVVHDRSYYLLYVFDSLGRKDRESIVVERFLRICAIFLWWGGMWAMLWACWWCVVETGKEPVDVAWPGYVDVSFCVIPR